MYPSCLWEFIWHFLASERMSPKNSGIRPWKTASAICFFRANAPVPIESLDVQRISEGLLVNKTTKELQDLLDLWGIRRASVDKICAVPTTGGFSDVLKETVCTSQETLEKRNTMTRPKVKLNKRLRFFSQDLTRLLLARKLIQLPGVLDSARNRADLHSFCVKKAQTCDLQLANGTIKRGVSHNRSGRSRRQRHQEAASGTWDSWMGCWWSRWCCWKIRQENLGPN